MENPVGLASAAVRHIKLNRIDAGDRAVEIHAPPDGARHIAGSALELS